MLVPKGANFCTLLDPSIDDDNEKDLIRAAVGDGWAPPTSHNENRSLVRDHVTGSYSEADFA